MSDGGERAAEGAAVPPGDRRTMVRPGLAGQFLELGHVGPALVSLSSLACCPPRRCALAVTRPFLSTAGTTGGEKEAHQFEGPGP